jgi:hypothetical protein
LNAINSGGNDEVIGAQLNAVGDIQLLSLLPSQTATATAAGLQLTANSLSVYAADSLAVNAQDPVRFNNSATALNAGGGSNSQSIGTLTVAAGTGTLTLNGLQAAVLSAENSARFSAVNGLTLNSLGTALDSQLAINSQRDLQLTASQRTDTNGEVKWQSNRIESLLQSMTVTSAGVMRVTAAGNNRGSLLFSSDATTDWQASNDLLVAISRGFGSISFTTAEEYSDIQLRAIDLQQRKSLIQVSSGADIAFSAVTTMRADADNGMTFTTQTGQIGVYATTNSALLASGGTLQLQATDGVAVQSGTNSQSAFNPIAVSATGAVSVRTFGAGLSIGTAAKRSTSSAIRTHCWPLALD